jgi:DNA-binding CsgD family transcriptional regulator
MAELTGDRLSIGRDPSCEVCDPTDETMSRLHAVVERIGARWCVRDLGSVNGTYLNGQRLSDERPLRADDEIRTGTLRVVFRSDGIAPQPPTLRQEPPPPLTAREREVLLELCRPILASDAFCEPAAVRTIAGALFVSEGAIKQHLARLYEKFGVEETEGRRRIKLANEAIRRGAVGLGDLRG